MLQVVGQTLASIAAVPVLGVLDLIHDARTGAHTLLEVQVDHVEEPLELERLLEGLRRAARDPRIEVVLLNLRAPPGGWAACQDLARVITELREADVSVHAMLETPGNALVWLASFCSRVHLVPTGQLLATGIGAELTFFGSALAQLGVEADFVAAGAYKSFGETYSRTHASPANQEAITELVGDLQRQLVEGIAKGRGLTAAFVEQCMERSPLSAKEALEAGLVDELCYADQLLHALQHPEECEERTQVDFGPWSRRVAARQLVQGWGTVRPVIAVLHLAGAIDMDGNSPNGIHARSAVKVIDALHDNDKVKAVVLHVNSPGGNAVASDLIWRAVQRLREEKPVVACYSDVSASGGVYLSAAANHIFSREGTLTGSIGVFGGKLVLGGAMRRVGVHSQSLSALPNATLFSATRTFTRPQRERFKASLERFYDHFVQRVAAGRGRMVSDIEPHCRGRVWTGRAAVERGLVDELGDLTDGLAKAAELAQLGKAWRRRDLTADEPRNPLLRLLQKRLQRLVPGFARLEALAGLPGAELLPPNLRFIVSHPNEPLMMLPFDLGDQSGSP